jgi:ABC-type transport system involved in Fe-S cluster assembly fused permease/ATPase subunit
MQAGRKVAGLADIAVLIWAAGTPFVKRRVLTTLILIVLASAAAAIGPVALKVVVDRFVSHPEQHSVPVLLLCLYVLSQFTAHVITEIRGSVYARAERRVFRILSERLFAHVMHLPMRFHMERETGAIAQILENALQGYQLITNQFVFAVLPGAVELCVATIVLLKLRQPVFLAMFVGGIACSVVAFGYFAARIAGPARNASRASVAATAAMTDPVLNYETVKFFAAENMVQERVSHALAHTEQEWIRWFGRWAAFGARVAIVYAIFLAVAVFYAAYGVEAGKMTIGAFVLVNTYMLQAIRPIQMLGNAMQALSRGVGMLSKIAELLRERPESISCREEALHTGPASLIFDRVSFAYRPDKPVLKEISFALGAGKILGIVGESGSGKSTIVRLLMRMVEPDSGRILLDGVSTSALPLSEVRRQIAVVPQETVLFNDTIAYNIGFGKPASSRQEIEEAARIAHLHDFIMSLPERYETKVGERGVKLSGGERQRISIARAVLKRPRIYVFDEATSSVDNRTEREILRNLSEISESSTTIIIAHRLSTVMRADEIIVLGACSILERGSHSELMEVVGSYKALWQAER